MSDQNPSRGELSGPVSIPATVVEAFPGIGAGGIPVIRPAFTPPAPSPSASPLGLLLAVRRRLALAVGLAVLTSGIAGTAAWFLVPMAKFKARAILKVDSQQPKVVFRVDNQSNEDYKRYQKTQLNLLRSRMVLSSALSEEGISKLETVKDQDEQTAWLQENLEAQFLGESEILEISLSGDRPEDLKRLVNAVTRAYMDEIVNRESKARMARQDLLKKLSKTYSDMMKSRRETIRKLAQQAGSDDRQTLVLQKQFAMEHLASLRKELAEVESQKRKAEATLRARGPTSLQETAAPLVSNAEVDGLVGQDSAVRELGDRLADMEQRLASETAHSKQVARNSAMNPALKKLRDEITALKSSLAKRRAEARRLVIRRLQDPESAGEPSRKDGARQQLAILEDVAEHLRADIEKHNKTDERLTDNTLDLQDLQDDLTQIQQAAAKISNEVEVLNVELQAPNRINVIENAERPTSRDEKKRYLMIGVITFGSFLGVLFGVAFLELQARKIDSAEEVAADLGIAVVGALPMLPSKTRSSGALQRTAKDRFWYNLLLESVDATRTMLVHAARSGGYRVVMITSALPGEGKTSLASHLATSLARGGLRTLLIDADLRSPSIHRLFELSQEPGMSELLRAEAGLHDVLASTAIAELHVITAGRCDHKTLRILAQGGMGGIFSRFKEQYDFVIVDTSPVLPVTDPLLIAQQCDAVLFSILRDVSRKDKISAAFQRLSTLNVPILGAVVTGHHDGSYGKSYYPGAVYETTPATEQPEAETGQESTS